MNRDKNPMYVLALVAGAAIAAWAGLPIVFLFLLACPLMMFFMMRGMGGMGGSSDSTRDQDTAKHDVGKPDGSHERIDQP
ncbi:MAG: DUF2933 domain-containing protein [Ornithinibacter sp.]